MRPFIEENKGLLPGSRTAFFAASDVAGTVSFSIPGQGAHTNIAAMLPPTPGTEKNFQTVTVQAQRLDTFMKTQDQSLYNVMVIDVEGAEDKVLKGAPNTLKHLEVVIIEYTEGRGAYQGIVQLAELKKIMARAGFQPIKKLETWGLNHGDILFIKKKFVPKNYCTLVQSNNDPIKAA